MPFRQFGLPEPILRALSEVGFTEPTPIQTAAIPPILEGRDVVGLAQTGTGKTAAFVLPLLARLVSLPAVHRDSPRLLVLAPTRELALQIEESVRIHARHLSITLATVMGGVGERPQIEALRRGVRIVIATPGRLMDLLKGGHLNFDALRYLVLDEADRMLDMGFLPDIRKIVRALPKERQTLLFSATFPPEIESVAREFQHAPQIVQVGKRSNPAETVAQWVYLVPRGERLDLLLGLLEEESLNTVLVFTRTRHGADRIARRLSRAGVLVAALHSDRTQSQRLKALHSFKSGLIRVLVATDIASRGIDVEGISHVINFDFPAHPEDYVHRIGRTGRARQVGDAISFVTEEDGAHLRSLERFLGRGLPRRALPAKTGATGHSSPADRTPRDSARPPEPARRPPSEDPPRRSARRNRSRP